MARNSRDNSAERSCSRSDRRGRDKKRGKERSPSGSRAGKKDMGKRRPSPQWSRSRSPSRDRNKKKMVQKRSPSRKRGRSRKRSPEAKKPPNRSPSPIKGKGKQFAGKQAAPPAKVPGPPSPNSRQRASPSYDRGTGKPAENGTRDREASRSVDSYSERGHAPQMEVVSLSLADRPFGMAPSKEEGVSGYVVAKVAEDKPADQAGVRHGWRVVSVAGKPCRELDSEEVQVLLKGAALPVAVEFEREKVSVVSAPAKDEDKDSDGDEEEQELDILDVRAEHRMNNQAGLDLIDDMPVKRTPPEGEVLPEPIASWQDAVERKLLNKALLEKLQASGLKRPTPIQRHALPIVGHKSGYFDMIASAQTGSGKTFAFVIPTVARLVIEGAMPRPFFPGAMAQAGPLVVILSPTRELAMQTGKEIEVMIKGTSLSVQCIYGGESLKFQQQKLLQEQKDIICATPGRLVDLVDARKVTLTFVQSVVLDEADQMLEQSLEIMCAELLTGRDMPDKEGRQTLLFSATMPQKIRDMCPKVLRTPRLANLLIGHYQEDKGGSCASIRQVLRWVPEEKNRIQAMVHDLHHLWIGTGKKGRVVVFANQRVQAGYLQGQLCASGINTLHLHGKLDQSVREEVFDKFRKGQADVLVATNVASRGLDFPDITFVVQYNLPGTIDIYTHRIGRTGRVGQVGCALAYAGPKDRHLFPKLVEFLELNSQEVPGFLVPRDSRRSPPRGGGRWHSGGDHRGGGHRGGDRSYNRSRSRGRRRNW